MATGCYTPQYLPAIYKGVPFQAMEVTSEHGRRGAEGEFPFGEQTGYADLGRKIRRYTIEARFEENNHILQAAALIAAVETPGSGILSHPTRGVILSAACTSLKIKDKVEDEQGVTYISLEFVEANNWPNGLSLVGQLLGLVLNSIIGPARENFRSTYAPNSIQPFRKVEVVGQAQDQIANIRNEFLGATTDLAGDVNRNSISRDLELLETDLESASNVEMMDKGLALGMNAVAINVSGSDKYSAFKRIANGAALSSSLASPAQETESAIYTTVRTIAAAYMAEGVLEQDGLRTGELFEAIDAIDSILNQEEAYARSSCDNEYYMALSEFKTKTISTLYAKAYDAPGLIEYDFNGRVHSLAAAYSIFGDAKRHRELESINSVGISGRIGPEVTASRGTN